MPDYDDAKAHWDWFVNDWRVSKVVFNDESRICIWCE